MQPDRTRDTSGEVRTSAHWKIRLNICNAAIDKARRDGDEKTNPEGWERLVDQQRQLNKRYTEAVRRERQARGEAEPEPIVIGMKAAKLKGRASGRPA